MGLLVTIAVLVLGGVAFALMHSGGSAAKPAAKQGAGPAAASSADGDAGDEKRRFALAKRLRDAAGALDRVRLHIKAGDDANFLKSPCETVLGSFDVIASGLRKRDEKRLGTDLSERLRLVLAAHAPLYQELSRLREGQAPVGRTNDVLLRSGELLRSAADALGGAQAARAGARA